MVACIRTISIAPRPSCSEGGFPERRFSISSIDRCELFVRRAGTGIPSRSRLAPRKSGSCHDDGSGGSALGVERKLGTAPRMSAPQKRKAADLAGDEPIARQGKSDPARLDPRYKLGPRRRVAAVPSFAQRGAGKGRGSGPNDSPALLYGLENKPQTIDCKVVARNWVRFVFLFARRGRCRGGRSLPLQDSARVKRLRWERDVPRHRNSQKPRIWRATNR